MINITYANNRVKKYFKDYDKMRRKLSLDWTRKIKGHMIRLEASDDFGDFLDLGLGHPEQLQKKDSIQYSLHVDANVRLIIELYVSSGTIRECTEIEVIGVCDYHGDKENWYIS